jgi:RNA polymerase sigma-70 factor (ECF subfamily)
VVAVESIAIRAGLDIRVLYEEHSGRLFRFALAFSGSESRASEAVQEAFLELIRKPDLFDPSRGSAAALLYGMVRNRLRIARRQEREESFEEEEASGDDLLEGLDRADRVAAVREAVLALPEHYREVVVLCELEECRYEEVALALEIPVGTVRSRLNRAKALLRSRLRHLGGNHEAR